MPLVGESDVRKVRKSEEASGFGRGKPGRYFSPKVGESGSPKEASGFGNQEEESLKDTFSPEVRCPESPEEASEFGNQEVESLEDFPDIGLSTSDFPTFRTSDFITSLK